VLTKKDLLSEEQLDMILNWVENEGDLDEAVENRERGMVRELTLTLVRAFREFGSMPELIPISSKYHQGIDTLFGAIQNVMNEDDSSFY
jgi:hypothetical protein